uniref:Uncharacterized protein n=1 Tax=Panagrolaimus sp. ES5 TaxID=591445 RepID=A0AC34GN18_9BILA
MEKESNLVEEVNHEFASNNVEEKVDFGDDSESDEDDVIITIGDINTDLPSKRNIQEFTKEYKPPSRIIITFPTTEEIQQKLESAMNEKQQQIFDEEETNLINVRRLNNSEDGNWRNKDASNIPFTTAVSFSDGSNFVDESINTKSNTVKKRISINKVAAEKLPPYIRNIVTSVAESFGSSHAVKIPTVNFSTSLAAAATMNSIDITAAKDTVTLPPEYNPNIPPPKLPNALKSTSKIVEEKLQKDAEEPISPVKALLRQFYNEDYGLSKSRQFLPDSNAREQHRRHIERNRRQNPERLENNYRKPVQFFNSSIATSVKR